MATTRMVFNLVANDSASAAFEHLARSVELSNASIDRNNAAAGRSSKALDDNSRAIDRNKTSHASLLVSLEKSGKGFSNLWTAAVAMAPAALPAIGLVAAGVIGLGGILASTGAAMGVFGMTAKSQFTALSAGYKQIETLKNAAALAAPGSAAQANDYRKLALEQQKYTATFGPAAAGMNNMQNAWKAWKQSTSGPTLSILAEGMNLVATALPKLKPLFDTGAQAATAFLNAIKGWVAGGGMDRAVKMLNDLAKAIGPSMQATMKNLASIAGALAPLFYDLAIKVARGMASITGAMAAWMGNKGVDAMNSFMAYIKANGPAVWNLLKTLADAAVNIVKALAPLAPISLAIATALARLVAAAPPQVIQAVAIAFVAYSLGVKAVAVWVPVAAAVTAGWAAAQWLLNDACIGTRIQLTLLAIQEFAVATAAKAWAAAQWLLNVALSANPIGLVIIAIAALAAALYLAWTHSATFRDIVIGAFNAVKTAVEAVVNWFAGPFLSFFTTTMPGVFTSAWNTIRAVFTTAWAAIQAVFTTALGTIQAVLTAAWNTISAAVTVAWTAIRAVFTTTWAGIQAVFTTALAAIQAALTAAWAAASAAVTVAWTAIRAVFTTTWAAIQALFAAALSAIQAALTAAWAAATAAVTATWNAIRAFFQTTWAAIQALFATALAAIQAALTAAWNAINAAIQSTWNAIRSFFSTTWAAIQAVFTAALSAVQAALSAAWNAIQSSTQAVWNAINAFIQTAMNTFQNIINTVLNTVVSFFSALGGRILGALGNIGGLLVSSGQNLINGLLNGIKAVWTTVEGWFKGLPSKILSALGIASPPAWAIDAGSHIMNGILKGLAKGGDVKTFFMGIIKDVTGPFKSIWSVINSVGSAIGSVGSAIGSFISSAVGGGGGGVEQWRSVVLQALALNGLSPTFANQVLYQMQTESGGNPNITNNWDSNAAAGTPSTGLMQVIGPTFAAYHVAGTSNNINDPLANVAAALNYAKNVYGPNLGALGSGHGYARGSWDVPVTGPAVVHQGEMILPAELAAAVRSSIGAGSGPQPDRIERLLRELIATTAAVPAATGRHVGGAISGAAGAAGFRSRYPAGGS